jgi:GST-like protein
MIDAYAWTTPNGQKLLIALDELAVPHTLHWIDLTKGEQKAPAYLGINPNNKIPAIVDPDGPGGQPITVFESGAVLLYLADKTNQLIPQGGRERYLALEWMFFNTGSAPLIGQLGYHLLFAKERDEKAIERFKSEVERQFGVLDRRLAENRFLTGPEFSIVDIMNFTWPNAATKMFGLDLTSFPHLKRWLGEIGERPSVVRALARTPG